MTSEQGEAMSESIAVPAAGAAEATPTGPVVEAHELTRRYGEGDTAGDALRGGSLSDTEITKLRRKHIGFVFQFFNLLPMLTAEENVLLPLTIAGKKPDKEFYEGLLEDIG